MIDVEFYDQTCDVEMRRQTAVQPDVGAFHYPVLGLAFRSKRDKEGQ